MPEHVDKAPDRTEQFHELSGRLFVQSAAIDAFATRASQAETRLTNAETRLNIVEARLNALPI